ncbi:MAG: molecular chaperone DnaJ [Acidobacteriota bacterium]|nr:molecular chaperone DnaJ [Acidobacteriota bacterium]
MCNPRRVEVTLTRSLSEAWERAVRRTVAMTDRVVGEARVSQPLDTALGVPALRALETALARGVPGWEEVEAGWRHDVDGGYVIYRPEERALEIVATRADEISAEGSAEEVVSGVVEEKLSTTTRGRYYDDGYGGRTEDVARNEATREGNRQLDRLAQSRVAGARESAEREHGDTVEARAREAAQREWNARAEERRAQLAEAARAHLEAVGVRCRASFHQLLALAYRDAILAYARRQGAEDISCNEEGGVVDIEFRLPG